VKLLTRLMALLLAVLLASCAQAHPPLDRAALDQAVAAGGPVVVHFHANWCPTCKAQTPVVAQLLSEPPMQAFKLFIADFDNEKALKAELHVNAQSTFVVFKGGREVARSTGQTSREAIAATFARAL
jgi:thiol-disulfide isomerase/thioredoxin